MFSEGKKLLDADHPEEALDILRQAIGILGPKEEYVQLLAQSRRRIEERRKARIAELLATARDALTAGRFSTTLECVSGVLELEPDRADAIDLRRQAMAGAEAEKARLARKEQAERDKAAGFKLLADKKFRESLRALQRAREVMGDDTAVRLGIEEAEEGIRGEELRARLQSELDQALQLFQTDALDKARAHVDRALEMSPRSTEASELAAKIDRAIEVKQRAERLSALLRDAREALGRQSFEEAAVLASEALILDPAPDSAVSRLLLEIAESKEGTRRAEEVKLLLRKTEDALERHDYDDAELHVGEALKVRPDHPASAELLQRVRQAREDRRFKQELNELISQAQQAFLQGSLGQSEALARRALVLDPGSTKAKDMIRRIDSVHEKARKEKVAVLVAEGDRLLASGDAAGAVAKAREALEADPQNADAAAFLRRMTEIEAQRRRDELAALLAGSRSALDGGQFEKAKELALQALALEDGNKAAKGLLKDIEKTARVAQKEREKAQRDTEKEQRKKTREADRDKHPAPAAVETVRMEKTVILPPPGAQRKSSLPLWAGAAALIVLLGAAGGTWWYLHRPGPVATPAQRIAEARASMDRSLYVEAIAELQRTLQEFPGNTEAEALLKEAQRQKGLKEVSLLLLEAQGQRAQNLPEESRKTLQRILQIDPANEPALAILSQLDAEASSNKSGAEQEIEIKKWLVEAAAYIGAGKLVEARAELAKVAQLRPDAPELGPLRRQIAAKAAEAAKKQQKDLDQAAAAQKASRSAELGRKAADLFKQGKYGEAQTAAEQWLAEDPASGPAQSLKNQAAEAGTAQRAYDTAMAANNYDEALGAVTHLEKLNPGDSAAAELRKRAETRKASARASFSIYRLGDPGTLLLDDQSLGTNGEVENKSIPVGRHKITVKTARGHQSTLTRDFFDGENISLVYDADLRLMNPGDRDLLRQRAARETVSRYTVEHTHGFLKGKCTGELRISGVSVEYQASEKEHSFSIPFRSLKLSLKDDDKLEFSDLHNAKYSFKVASAKVQKEIKERWDRLEKMGR